MSSFSHFTVRVLSSFPLIQSYKRNLYIPKTQLVHYSTGTSYTNHQHRTPSTEQSCNSPTHSTPSFSQSRSAQLPFPTHNQLQQRLQDHNVDGADNPVAKPSVKLQLTHLHNVDAGDNLAAKSSVPLKHSPMPLRKPLPNPKTIASLLNMPDGLQETSLPLLPRLKTIQKDTMTA